MYDLYSKKAAQKKSTTMYLLEVEMTRCLQTELKGCLVFRDVLYI